MYQKIKKVVTKCGGDVIVNSNQEEKRMEKVDKENETKSKSWSINTKIIVSLQLNWGKECGSGKFV